MVQSSEEIVAPVAVWQYLKEICSEEYVEELLEIVRDYTGDELPNYSDSLRAAFREVEPIFTRPRYAEFFWHCATTIPAWTARVILNNAQGESEGSEKLLDLWRGIRSEAHVADQVMAHARDESRHSRIFIRLTERAFPSDFESSDLQSLEARLPDVRVGKHEKARTRIPENHIIDHLVQMNIGEIRTRLHMHLFAPVVHGMAPADNKRAVRRLLGGLVRDEVRHIGYTAKLMESWAESGSGGLIRRLYRGRLKTFDQMTYQQTQDAVHHYGQGRFPDLLDV